MSDEEWNRYLGTILDTLTEDCAMEVRSAGIRFEGRNGAREFYETFIPSFEGMQWEPQALMIGPQGVLDVRVGCGELNIGGDSRGVGLRREELLFYEPHDSTDHLESTRMPTFVLRLIAPRPNFAQTLTDAERAIMSCHAAHWRPYLDRGDMVVFGPILTDEDSYGIAVVETEDEQALREFAARDPVVTTGTAAFEFGRMAAGTVRAR